MNMFRIGFFLLILFVSAWDTLAGQISFLHSGVGSGSIGGLLFTNASFSILELGDTGNRTFWTNQGNVGFYIDDTSATINISNRGSFHLTIPTRTFVNNTLGIVGFSRAADFTDLFDGPSSDLFRTWDMLTQIGPITTPNGFLVTWSSSPVTTDGGVLAFDTKFNLPATFQATLIPEPSSFPLLIGAVAYMAIQFRGFRLRQRSA
jgi:hypothetical protein